MNKIIFRLVAILLSFVSGDTLLKIINKGLNLLEERVKKTETKYDDAVILPLIDKLKNVL